MLLDTVVSCFYFRHSEGAGKDHYLYRVLTYLIVFHLDQVQASGIQHLTVHVPPLKIHVFLSFLFDRHVVEDWLRSELALAYDAEFVDVRSIE